MTSILCKIRAILRGGFQEYFKKQGVIWAYFLGEWNPDHLRAFPGGGMVRGEETGATKSPVSLRYPYPRFRVSPLWDNGGNPLIPPIPEYFLKNMTVISTVLLAFLSTGQCNIGHKIRGCQTTSNDHSTRCISAAFLQTGRNFSVFSTGTQKEEFTGFPGRGRDGKKRIRDRTGPGLI